MKGKRALLLETVTCPFDDTICARHLPTVHLLHNYNNAKELTDL